MPRRKAPWVVIGLFVLFAMGSAVIGSLSAPDRHLWDVRRSSDLRGPDGMKGLADALERLGVPVERRRHSFFGIADDSSAVDPSAILSIVALIPQPVRSSYPMGGTRGALPTMVERRELMRYVERGGALLLAGRTGVEGCLGLEVARHREPAPLVLPAGVDSVPPARYIIERAAVESEGGGNMPDEDASQTCVAPPVMDSRTLLKTTSGFTVARHLDFEGGGRVILLADSRYLSNGFLRNTDAGVVVLPLLLREHPSRVIFDEYHQGFGWGGSIYGAALAWMVRSPGGWMIIQCVVAGLLALAIAAVRFGPLRRLSAHRRRSPLEHLDALAVGLERAEGRKIAVQLIISGLRRRLGRAGYRTRTPTEPDASWLDGLALAARSAEAHAAVSRLGTLSRQEGGDERVLGVATAVEDVWQALRQPKTHEPS